jgi:hypothetical protein
MSRMEEVELTNMCMICDSKGNVLVQNKQNHPSWRGWNFPGGHVEKGEYIIFDSILYLVDSGFLTIEEDDIDHVEQKYISPYKRKVFDILSIALSVLAGIVSFILVDYGLFFIILYIYCSQLLIFYTFPHIKK